MRESKSQQTYYTFRRYRSKTFVSLRLLRAIYGKGEEAGRAEGRVRKREEKGRKEEKSWWIGKNEKKKSVCEGGRKNKGKKSVWKERIE